MQNLGPKIQTKRHEHNTMAGRVAGGGRGTEQLMGMSEIEIYCTQV
jgi:hypothetical protein